MGTRTNTQAQDFERELRADFAPYQRVRDFTVSRNPRGLTRAQRYCQHPVTGGLRFGTLEAACRVAQERAEPGAPAVVWAHYSMGAIVGQEVVRVSSSGRLYFR